MKIIANIQPFTYTQTFQIVREDNSGIVEAEFSTTLDKIEEDLAAQVDKYDVKDIYLHGNVGYLDKIQKRIQTANMTKYNNNVNVYII